MATHATHLQVYAFSNLNGTWLGLISASVDQDGISRANCGDFNAQAGLASLSCMLWLFRCEITDLIIAACSHHTHYSLQSEESSHSPSSVKTLKDVQLKKPWNLTGEKKVEPNKNENLLQSHFSDCPWASGIFTHFSWIKTNPLCFKSVTL